MHPIATLKWLVEDALNGTTVVGDGNSDSPIKNLLYPISMKSG